MLSYGFNFLIGNTVNNTPGKNILANVPHIAASPFYLPSFLLSTLGAQFTPSSAYMIYVSQLLGLLVLILLFRIRRSIRESVVLTQIIQVCTFSIVLFTLTGYDGTLTSIQNAYSNRYVTSTMLIGILLVISINKTYYRKVLISALLILSLASGLKSGLEWVSVRHSQSQLLEQLCYSNIETERGTCLDLACSQSFYSNKQNFSRDLTTFLEAHR